MKMTKEILRTLLISILIGAIIGTLVGSSAVLLMRASLYPYSLYGGIAGVCIGLFASAASVIFMVYAGKLPLPAFLTVCLIIAAGTVLGSWLSGLRIISIYLWLLIISEIIGLSIMIFWYRTYIKLNKRLREFQQKNKM